MIRYAENPKHYQTSPATRCARSLTERMAEDLREAGFSGQGDVQSLVDRGWSRATVIRLGPTAIAIARRQSVRQIARG
ncbi:hypothetical protein [Pseudorhizobium pelagicum]|uniref:Uncharacterized protein n=1 Tax=Pseudorhizobium pelagicum TaxID=1509405 RepID=A0A922T7F6_9HYPH|nr:hypothetical protein [Pseudorhizobium pelagicum]KEQ05730.1 hypothetical protein GV67_04010 [Pseudorhizobium pelagicum]KEQ06410.1 hypothetical protein GV68_07005 [Pseudorhizobium pelagicum]